MTDRPALQYAGGKFSLSQWIITFFPEHETYIEPYGGAMSVLLNKPLSKYEVYNDKEQRVVNFFSVLRQQPDLLIEQISLTPYSRDEAKRSALPHDDPLEDARRFYAMCMQSRGLSSPNSTGWKYAIKKGHTNMVKTWRNNAYLYDIADRILDVFIESDDALNVINRFDTKQSLVFADPPYPHSSRSGTAIYAYEMNNGEHIELIELLHACESMVVLSSYPNDLYNDYLLTRGWQMETKESHNINNVKRTEALYIKPNTINKRTRQLSLFSE